MQSRRQSQNHEAAYDKRLNNSCKEYLDVPISRGAYWMLGIHFLKVKSTIAAVTRAGRYVFCTQNTIGTAGTIDALRICLVPKASFLKVSTVFSVFAQVRKFLFREGTRPHRALIVVVIPLMRVLCVKHWMLHLRSSLLIKITQTRNPGRWPLLLHKI